MRFAPKVSVVIPTYNYAHYLDETIQSVLAQTFTDFELIIVDNCSTDNTNEVVKRYLTDARVSFHKNETNIGLVGNWNKCLDYAQGTYIKFLCADDKFHPRLLEVFVPVIERHPNVSLVSSHNEIFGERTRPRAAPFTGQVSGQVARKHIIVERGKNWLCGPTAVMFRRAAIKKVGKFNPQLIAVVDLEYWLRLLTIGDCYIIPECLSYFRSHGGTQTAAIRKKKYERVFENYRFINSVKCNSTSETDPIYPAVNAILKRRALRCVAVMYKLLPKLYKRENRMLFKKAYTIGRAEGVLAKAFFYYLKWDYVVEFFSGK